MKKLNRNITEEEDSRQCLKFLTQSAIKKTTLHHCQGSKRFIQSPAEALTSLFPIYSVFEKTNKGNVEAFSRQTYISQLPKYSSVRLTLAS